ncbi:MAG: HlyU family transcriptional regulator [Pseudomonadota bacterium]
MMGFLKKLFAGGGPGSVQEYMPVEYNGYRIIPTPMKDSQGFRVQGRIEMDVDGETRVHQFIRADMYFSVDDTLAVIEQKAKRMIDEQGTRLFDR